MAPRLMGGTPMLLGRMEALALRNHCSGTHARYNFPGFASVPLADVPQWAGVVI